MRAGRDDVDELAIPVNDLALEAGSVRSANVVALAAFAARSTQPAYAYPKSARSNGL